MSGLFSRFLKDSKRKSVQKSADSTPLEASENFIEDEDNQAHVNEKDDQIDAIDFEAAQASMSPVTHDELTIG